MKKRDLFTIMSITAICFVMDYMKCELNLGSLLITVGLALLFNSIYDKLK